MKIFLTVTCLVLTVIVSSPAGPMQIDHIAPEPTGKMVDPATGDFTYQINLGPVNSPTGKMFDLNLVYKAGIKYNQEASWVGLGWSLSVGAINRTVVGYPDDYRNEEVRNYLRPTSVEDRIVLPNPLGYGHPISLSGSYPNGRKPRGTSFGNTLLRTVNGYLYSSPAAMLYRVDTYNSVLKSLMQGRSSWLYGMPGDGGNGRSPRAPQASEGIRVLEYLEYNGFNLPAQDHYSVSAPGLSGEFRPYSHSSLHTYYSKYSEDNGNIGNVTNGAISSENLWNRGSSKISPDFSAGFAFKMTTEGALNLVDNPGGAYVPSSQMANIDELGAASKAGNVGGTRIVPIWDSNDKLGGFVLTKQDGTNYYFTLPLYTFQHISYSTGELPGAITEFPRGYGEFAYEGSFREDLGTHANSWLLTAITGPDYVKMKTGEQSWDLQEKLLPHDGDLGSWATLRYEFSNGVEKAVYPWREPYGEGLQNSFNTNTCGSERVYHTQFGLREITYLKSIETPSEVISFKHDTRSDNLGANFDDKYPKTPSWSEEEWAAFESKHTMTLVTNCLEEIAWFSKTEIPVADGAMSYKSLTDAGSPYRRALFCLPYILGKQTPNSGAKDEARLTLTALKIGAPNGEGSAYRFGYQLADEPYRANDKIDLWGYSEGVSRGTAQQGLAWNLNKISTPAGATIRVQYERDYMHSVLGTLMDMERTEECPSSSALRYDMDNSEGYYSIYNVTSYDGKKTITLDRTVDTGLRGNHVITEWRGTYLDANRNYISVTNNDYIYRIANVEGKKIVLSNKIPFERAKAGPSNQTVFNKDGLKRIYVINDRGYRGQNIRVSQVTTEPIHGKKLVKKYDYNGPAAVGALPDLSALPVLFRTPGFRGEGTIPSYNGVYYDFDKYKSGPFKIDKMKNGMPGAWSKVGDLPQKGSYAVVQKYGYRGHSFLSLTANWYYYPGGNEISHRNWDKIISCVKYYSSSGEDRETCQDYYNETRGCNDELIFHVHNFGPGSDLKFTRKVGVKPTQNVPVPKPAEGDCKYRFVLSDTENPIEDRNPELKGKLIYGSDYKRSLPWVDNNSTISIPNFVPGYYKINIVYYSENSGRFELDREDFGCYSTTGTRKHTSILTGEEYTGKFTNAKNEIKETLHLESFNLRCISGSAWIKSIKLVADGGLTLQADWRTMRDNAFEENAVGVSTNMTEAYYPSVRISTVNEDGDADMGYTVYRPFTSNDTYGNELLLKEEITEGSPRLMAVKDYTELIGRTKRVEKYSTGDGSRPTQITEYKYAFGTELADETDEKYRGVFHDVTGPGGLLGADKPLGVVVERSIRREPSVTAVFEHTKLRPYLASVNTVTDNVKTKKNYRLFNARTGTATVLENPGSADENRITFQEPQVLIEPSLSRKRELESKNLYSLIGGKLISDYYGSFSTIDDLTGNYCCTPETSPDYKGRVQRAVSSVFIEDPFSAYNTPPYGQTRYIQGGVYAWKGGDSFLWPAEGNRNDWQLTHSVSGINTYGLAKTIEDATGRHVTSIYHPFIGQPVATVANANYQECAAFTCDYEMVAEEGKEYFDRDNGWLRHSGGSLTDRGHFGRKSLHIGDHPLGLENSLAISKIIRVEGDQDYVFSVWANIAVDDLVLHVKHGTGQGWPVSGITVYGESDSDPYGSTDNKWKYIEHVVSIPSGSNQYVEISISGSYADVDDIRFYPDDALMNTNYYDPRFGLIEGVVDENNEHRRAVYDDLGRLTEVYNSASKLLERSEYGIAQAGGTISHPVKYGDDYIWGEGTEFIRDEESQREYVKVFPRQELEIGFPNEMFSESEFFANPFDIVFSAEMKYRYYNIGGPVEVRAYALVKDGEAYKLRFTPTYTIWVPNRWERVDVPIPIALEPGLTIYEFSVFLKPRSNAVEVDNIKIESF